MPNYEWLETLSPDQIVKRLESDQIHGLSHSQAMLKIKQFGRNELRSNRRSHIAIEFAKNLINPLVLVLLIIVALSFSLHDTMNGGLVLLMVLLSVILNFVQEHKATNAAEKLEEKVAVTATALREGQAVDIRAREVVTGDILILNAGDLIPADSYILGSKDFFVNQSVLTGEAYPVEKNAVNIDALQGSSNRTDAHLVFSGTSVVTGTATVIVIATGMATEFGRIAQRLTQSPQNNNFTSGIKLFSYFILRIIIVFVLVIFALNAILKHNFLDALTFAIAIAVGLTPEFLPMIMTVTMSKGAVIMAKKGVIVKKLTAIPSFGSMNILCTDKTGTLTEDRIRLVKYIDTQGADSDHLLKMTYINSSFQTGISNPLDQAILEYKKIDMKGYKKIDEIPFDFNRRRMSVVVDAGHERLLITKGAPEALFPQCSFLIRDGKDTIFNAAHQKEVLELYHRLSAEGYRVLAVATKHVHTNAKVYTHQDESALTLIGFTAFLDPIKPQVKHAIDSLEAIGIEVKVITGDNEMVTQKACKDTGILVKGLLLGHDITNMSDLTLARRASETTIFARFSPTEKERVIKALKLTGNVVGYMGDGINDSPSIRAADVGISVSNAVDVAKDSADFILTRKSLLQLKDAVIEGRVIFGNTMKYIMMGLSSNLGNMVSVLGAVIFLPFLPMIPIQILLNNFMYDLSQLTIPTDHVDSEYLLSPKRWDIHFIKKFMFTMGPISSLFDFITFYALYLSYKSFPHAFQTGWFLESLATQTLVIHIIRTRNIPFIQSCASKTLTISTVLVVGTAWILPFTSLGSLFNLVPLPLNTMLTLGIIVAGYLGIAQLAKSLFYKYSL